MESQPQNPEFRINPEKLSPMPLQGTSMTITVGGMLNASQHLPHCNICYMQFPQTIAEIEGSKKGFFSQTTIMKRCFLGTNINYHFNYVFCFLFAGMAL